MRCCWRHAKNEIWLVWAVPILWGEGLYEETRTARFTQFLKRNSAVLSDMDSLGLDVEPAAEAIQPMGTFVDTVILACWHWLNQRMARKMTYSSFLSAPVRLNSAKTSIPPLDAGMVSQWSQKEVQVHLCQWNRWVWWQRWHGRESRKDSKGDPKVPGFQRGLQKPSETGPSPTSVKEGGSLSQSTNLAFEMRLTVLFLIIYTYISTHY